MRVKWMTVAVAAGLALAATDARADDGRRVLGLGAFLGYSEAKDADEGAVHFGGELSMRFLEFLGSRLEVGYRQDEVNVSDPDGESFSTADVDYVPILLSAQLLPLGERANPFSPFVFGGVGLYLTEYQVDLIIDGESRSFDDRDVEIGWHAGTGLDFNLGNHITLTGDVRWVFLDTEFKDLREAEADGVWVTAGVKFFLQ